MIWRNYVTVTLCIVGVVHAMKSDVISRSAVWTVFHSTHCRCWPPSPPSHPRNSFHILRRWSREQTGHLEDKWDIISEQTCNRSAPFKRSWPLLPAGDRRPLCGGIRRNMPEIVHTGALSVSVYAVLSDIFYRATLLTLCYGQMSLPISPSVWRTR